MVVMYHSHWCLHLLWKIDKHSVDIPYNPWNSIFSICSIKQNSSNIIYRMARKTNVVDLNEIKSVNHQEATHTEELAPIEDITPEPAKREETYNDSPEEVPIMKKCDAKATCAFCNKVMTVKALRYSHDKNCKGKPKVEPVAPQHEEPPTPRHSYVEVVPESKPKAKPTKAELKQQRLNSLVSQAF